MRIFEKKQNEENSTLENNNEREAVFSKYLHAQRKYDHKYQKGRYHYLFVRLTIIIMNVSLLVLSLLQIRYNVFPVETITYYILISLILSLITLFESIVGLFALRNKIADYKNNAKSLDFVIKSLKSDNKEIEEVLKIYHDLINEEKEI